VNLYTRKLIKRDGVKKIYKLNNIFMDIRSDKINKEMTDDFDDEGKIKKNVKVSLTMDEEKYY
jgi:hypothetical protein